MNNVFFGMEIVFRDVFFRLETNWRENKKVLCNALDMNPFRSAFRRVVKISEPEGAHFRILQEKVPIFAKNVRFL